MSKLNKNYLVGHNNTSAKWSTKMSLCKSYAYTTANIYYWIKHKYSTPERLTVSKLCNEDKISYKHIASFQTQVNSVTHRANSLLVGCAYPHLHYFPKLNSTTFPTS